MILFVRLSRFLVVSNFEPANRGPPLAHCAARTHGFDEPFDRFYPVLYGGQLIDEKPRGSSSQELRRLLLMLLTAQNGGFSLERGHPTGKFTLSEANAALPRAEEKDAIKKAIQAIFEHHLSVFSLAIMSGCQEAAELICDLVKENFGPTEVLSFYFESCVPVLHESTVLWHNTDVCVSKCLGVQVRERGGANTQV